MTNADQAAKARDRLKIDLLLTSLSALAKPIIGGASTSSATSSSSLIAGAASTTVDLLSQVGQSFRSLSATSRDTNRTGDTGTDAKGSSSRKAFQFAATTALKPPAGGTVANGTATTAYATTAASGSA